MHINDMTRKDFDSLPSRKWDEEIEFNSMIILPGRAKEIHDSGYRVMDFVAVRKGKAVCRLSGCSDVVHLDGIGGFGYKWLDRYGTCPKTIPPSEWSIDCLPKSGLLHIWPGSNKMKAGSALSSFNVYAMPKAK